MVQYITSTLKIHCPKAGVIILKYRKKIKSNVKLKIMALVPKYLSQYLI